jgi:ubiquinone biosynthesis protein UbiJ
MTFTIPEEMAVKFLKRIPARDRSRYVTEAITAKLQEREEQLIRACEVANGDPDVLAIERDWEALAEDVDRISEPWNSASTR